MDTQHSSRQAEVTDAVWPWRKQAVEAVAPSRRIPWESLIVFAVGIILWFLGRRIAGTVVLCIGMVVLISGLFVPTAYRFLRKLGDALGRLVGAALTWALLVPFFYICFVPARLLLLITGKDPLRRRFRAASDSYWIDHVEIGDKKRYSRQY